MSIMSEALGAKHTPDGFGYCAKNYQESIPRDSRAYHVIRHIIPFNKGAIPIFDWSSDYTHIQDLSALTCVGANYPEAQPSHGLYRTQVLYPGILDYTQNFEGSRIVLKLDGNWVKDSFVYAFYFASGKTL